MISSTSLSLFNYTCYILSSWLLGLQSTCISFGLNRPPPTLQGAVITQHGLLSVTIFCLELYGKACKA